MTHAILFALLLGAAPPQATCDSLTDERSALASSIVQAYRTAKQEAPRADEMLSRAAMFLAEQAVRSSVHAATGSEALGRTLSAAGAWDPPPRAVAVRATPPAHAFATLGARNDLASTPASHFGLGCATNASGSAVVVALFTERKAWLEPFPREVEPGVAQMLRGELTFPRYDAQVFVTGPKGTTRHRSLATEARNRFAVRVPFPEPGRYTVEVVAQSVKGPEVAALFQVQAGPETPSTPRAVDARSDPLDDAQATAAVLSAINHRRRAAGLAPLARSSLLDTLAADHCAEMARLGYFAHVSPIQGDVAARARKAGFRYVRITENLGEASGALEAHRLIEASPGHLANVLDPGVELAGIGVSRVQRGGLSNVLVTEVFARPAP